MKAKKPLLITVFVLALLVVALILPAAATGNSDNSPTAWCSWGVSSAQRSPFGVVSTWSVEARQLSETTVGREVMNWVEQVTGGPEKGHYLTRDIVYSEFKSLGDGAYEATVIFRWEWEYSPTGETYHKFVLTDNPGNEPDHVLLQARSWAPGAPPPPWLPPDIPDWYWPLALFDVDTYGVQVVVK